MARNEYLYEVDLGTWERGLCLKVKAIGVREALQKAKTEARQRGHELLPVQAYRIDGEKKKLAWDCWNGLIP